MNTPDPCGTCGWLYSDCMYDDDPSYSAECMCGKPDCRYGGDCPNWIHWEQFSWTEAPLSETKKYR